MRKLGEFIVRHKIFIIIVFAVMVIPSIIGSFFVKTNYDMMSYLPDELDSVRGNNILSEEFGLSDIVYVLVYDKELWDTAKLKDNIGLLDGIKRIDWIDDFSDIKIPVDFIPKDIREQFISGQSTILQIQLAGENEKNIETDIIIDNIKNILDDSSYLAGAPVLTYELKKILDNEKIIYFIIGAVAIFIILSLSTSSIIEPVLLFISLGAAIIFNMGTNIFLRSISYTSSSVAAIIQLAVSVDYSIFLLHRYREEKTKHPSKEEAMITAISKTGTAVIASAATTVAGFASLLIMRIGIGKDLGLVLAKGVVLSLVTTIILLPCMVLLSDRFIEKTRHRIFLPGFKLVSNWAVKGKWIFFILIVVLLIPAYMAQHNLKYYSSLEASLPENTESVVATEKIKNDFGYGDIIYVVTESQDRIKEKEFVDKIKTIDVVSSVNSISSRVHNAIPDNFIPEELKDRFQNTDYSYISIQVSTATEDIQTIEAIAAIKEFADDIYGRNFYITGEPVLTKDMADLSKIDLKYVNLLSMSLIAIILALSFRSLSIPVLLIVAIEFAIWLNLSVPFIAGNPVYLLTSIFISAIQLGTTVDYAILLTSRYKENLALLEPVEAMKKTINDTGQSIFTSALILFAGTLGITLVSKIGTTSELTNMLGRGALISMAVILFGLPALLLVSERFICWTTLGWKRLKKDKAVSRIQIKSIKKDKRNEKK